MKRKEQIQNAAADHRDCVCCDFYDPIADARQESFIEGAEWSDEHPKEGMVSLEDVCKFLDEHLYTGTSTGDYDYGQEYIYSDFDNASDLIFALRKAMEE
jgi:hypothetical protein